MRPTIHVFMASGVITRYLKIAAPEMLRVTTPSICGRMLWK